MGATGESEISMRNQDVAAPDGTGEVWGIVGGFELRCAPDPAGLPVGSIVRIVTLDNNAARAAAQINGDREFMAICAKCGPMLHDTARGGCIVCEATTPGDARWVAGMIGASKYDGQCEAHGAALFWTVSGHCSHCFTPAGKRHGSLPTPRSIARHRGDTTYLAPCETCGEVDHFVTSGKCATCFTSTGARRGARAPGWQADPLRAEARRTGATSYLAECPAHGETAHHTIRGKCLTCFNSLGYLRKG